MKILLRSLALLGVMALVGCDSNPGGPDVGAGKNETGQSNITAEGTKSPKPPGKRGGGAEAPAPARAD